MFWLECEPLSLSLSLKSLLPGNSNNTKWSVFDFQTTPSGGTHASITYSRVLRINPLGPRRQQAAGVVHSSLQHEV